MDDNAKPPKYTIEDLVEGLQKNWDYVKDAQARGFHDAGNLELLEGTVRSLLELNEEDGLSERDKALIESAIIEHKANLMTINLELRFDQQLKKALTQEGQSAASNAERLVDLGTKLLATSHGAIVLASVAALSTLSSSPDGENTFEPVAMSVLPKVLNVSTVAFVCLVAYAFIRGTLESSKSKYFLWGARFPTAQKELEKRLFGTFCADEPFKILGMKVRPRRITYLLIQVFGNALGFAAFYLLLQNALTLSAALS